MRSPYYWKARDGWYVTYPKSDGKMGRRRLGTTKTEAMRAWKNTLPPDENPVALRIADRYITHLRAREKNEDVGKSHVDSVHRALREAVPPTIRWSSLTVEYVTKYVSQQGWRPGTVRTRLTHLRSLSKFGAAQYGLKDVLANLKKPAVVSRKKAVSREEYHQLLDFIFRNNRPKDHRLANMLAVLWMTGARPGELFRVKKTELVGDRLVMAKHKTSRKTGKPRIIYLTPAAKVAVLMAEGHDENIFADARGNAWHKDTFSARLNRMLKANSMDSEIVAYSFRHSFAGRALSSGVDIAVLAELMGTSVRMIEKHYGHLSDKQDLLKSNALKIR